MFFFPPPLSFEGRLAQRPPGPSIYKKGGVDPLFFFLEEIYRLLPPPPRLIALGKSFFAGRGRGFLIRNK